MTAIDDFARMCKPTSVEDLNRLARRAATHVDLIAEAALDSADLPVALAGDLAAGLTELAQSAVRLDADQRSWLGGAIAYFLLTGDAANDLGGPHGLEDDRDVFNEVCDRLERPDLKIQP